MQDVDCIGIESGTPIEKTQQQQIIKVTETIIYMLQVDLIFFSQILLLSKMQQRRKGCKPFECDHLIQLAYHLISFGEFNGIKQCHSLCLLLYSNRNRIVIRYYVVIVRDSQFLRVVACVLFLFSFRTSNSQLPLRQYIHQSI